MNLNLQHNSVGFYQLSKLACVPVVLVLQYFWNRETITWRVGMTLGPILFGVGYATVHDLDVNMVGLSFASCAVVATALAQIFTNSYQKSLKCDAMQLLYHTSPLIAAGMLGMSPFFDDLTLLPSFKYSNECILNIGKLVLALAAIAVRCGNACISCRYFLCIRFGGQRHELFGPRKDLSSDVSGSKIKIYLLGIIAVY